MPPIQVFISYSHDSPDHKDRVLALADRLRNEGVDCLIDQYEQSPAEGWPLWCQRQVERANFVLVVCTATYLRRFRGEEVPHRGLGVTWEGHILNQELYNSQGKNSKFIPIVFQEEDLRFIPLGLQSAANYRLDRDYELLYRRLIDRPVVKKHELGKMKDLDHRNQFPPVSPLQRQPDEPLPSAAGFSGAKEEDFLQREASLQLEMIGEDWIIDVDLGQIIGSGRDKFLLSRYEFGENPFTIQASLEFAKPGQEFAKAGQGDPGKGINAGIVFGWRNVKYLRYYNVLLTGNGVLVELTGRSPGLAGVSSVDVRHLTSLFPFKILPRTPVSFTISVADRVEVFANKQLLHSINRPRGVIGRVGLRPWHSKLYCSNFTVSERIS